MSLPRLPRATGILLLVLAGSVPTPAQESSRPIPPPKTSRSAIEAAVAAELRRILEPGQVPGGSAALILPDGSALTTTHGVSSQDTGRPLTAQDRLLSGRCW